MKEVFIFVLASMIVSMVYAARNTAEKEIKEYQIEAKKIKDNEITDAKLLMGLSFKIMVISLLLLIAKILVSWVIMTYYFNLALALMGLSYMLTPMQVTITMLTLGTIVNIYKRNDYEEIEDVE